MTDEEREPFSLERTCPKCLASDAKVAYRRVDIMGLRDEWLDLTCRCGFSWRMRVHDPAEREVQA